MRAVGKSLRSCVPDTTRGERWHSPGPLIAFCDRNWKLWGLIIAVRARGQTSRGMAGLASDTSAAFPGETPCQSHEVSIQITAGGATSVRGMKPAWTIEAMRIRPPHTGMEEAMAPASWRHQRRKAPARERRRRAVHAFGRGWRRDCRWRGARNGGCGAGLWAAHASGSAG